MRVRFLRSAAADVEWFLHYYETGFPAGLQGAKDGYRRTKKLLAENAFAGHPSDEEGLREFPVLRTPFLFIYRVTPKAIEVVRVWDQRSRRPQKWV